MRKKLLTSVVILILVAAIVWLVCSMLGYRTDRNYGFNRTKVDESQIATALESYSSTYSAFLSGDTESIERILNGEDLNGKNPRKIQFLNFRRSIEHTNEMVDPWGMPYKINFPSTKDFVIASAGKNKIFGDTDDIIFNSVSNGFVKP